MFARFDAVEQPQPLLPFAGGAAVLARVDLGRCRCRPSRRCRSSRCRPSRRRPSRRSPRCRCCRPRRWWCRPRRCQPSRRCRSCRRVPVPPASVPVAPPCRCQRIACPCPESPVPVMPPAPVVPPSVPPAPVGASDALLSSSGPESTASGMTVKLPGQVARPPPSAPARRSSVVRACQLQDPGGSPELSLRPVVGPVVERQKVSGYRAHEVSVERSPGRAEERRRWVPLGRHVRRRRPIHHSFRSARPTAALWPPHADRALIEKHLFRPRR